MPLIFKPKVASECASSRRRSMLERWSAADGEQAQAVRDQLERVAALVPETQRKRVLRPVLAPRSSDDQVRDAIGGLLLAATLSSTGWHVEYEPKVDGGTPDFRVTRDGAVFLVELRRVTGGLALGIQYAAIAKIQHALADFPRTRTPISIQHAAVEGHASLRQFKKDLALILEETALSRLEGNVDPQEHEVRCIAYEGVSVAFEVHQPFEVPMPVLFGWSQRSSTRSDAEVVRRAVNDKLGRYKQPLIVALDLVGLGEGFRAVTEALLGSEVYRIHVDLENRGAGPINLSRNADGVLAGDSHNALRARDRLVALLPFTWGETPNDVLNVQPRLLANPATPAPHSFDSFAPIPRLVVTKDVNGLREMRFLGELGAAPLEPGSVPSWSYTP